MKKIVILIVVILFIVLGVIIYMSYNNPKRIDYNDIKKDKIPKYLLENNMFIKYKDKAYKKLKSMSLDEKIGQIFLVRYPDINQVEDMKKYSFGGYLFFARDFKDKKYDEVKSMISNLQDNSKIPLLTAVDEEGGYVVRVSSNPNLRSERFPSSRSLFLNGGMDSIYNDTVEKSKLLSGLGINLNLAPVVDISQSEDDYMYSRSLGEDATTTGEFARTVIKASKEDNYEVSYTLKHFPGYGNNVNTHTGKAYDNRSYEDIVNNDLVPFKEGINEGAEAILISHNIVNSIDKANPSSLSKKVHDLLIDDLDFNGVIITDDLEMDAVGESKEVIYKAVTSGNDLIIVTDYDDAIKNVKDLIEEEKIDEKLIDKLVFKIISWKYYKKLLN